MREVVQFWLAWTTCPLVLITGDTAATEGQSWEIPVESSSVKVVTVPMPILALPWEVLPGMTMIRLVPIDEMELSTET